MKSSLKKANATGKHPLRFSLLQTFSLERRHEQKLRTNHELKIAEHKYKRNLDP